MKVSRDGQHPYLAEGYPGYDTAQEYSHDRYLRPATNANNWRLAFFLLLLLSAIQTVGLVLTTTRQQVVPHIVEGDEVDATRAIKELTPQLPLSPLVLKAVLMQWCRTCAPSITDCQVSILQTDRAYHRGLEPAQKVLAAYYHGTPPETRLARGHDFPVKITVVPVAGRTWRAPWQE